MILVTVCTLGLDVSPPGDGGGPLPIDDPIFVLSPSYVTYSWRDNIAWQYAPWQEFLQEAGPRWSASVDLRSARPGLIEGSGLPWYPGAGNGLTWEDLAAQGFRGPPLTPEMLAAMADAFLERHGDLLGVTGDQVRWEQDATAIHGRGRFAYVVFGQVVSGVPVRSARVFFRLNNGNLVQFGTLTVADVQVSPVPTLTQEDALQVLVSHVGASSAAELLDLESDELQFVPTRAGGEIGELFTGVPGTGYGHHLVWGFRFRLAGQSQAWEGWVDAHSGAILRFVDLTRFALVHGGVFPITNSDREEPRPLSYCFVDNGGVNNKLTDGGGLVRLRFRVRERIAPRRALRPGPELVWPDLAARWSAAGRS